MRIVYGLVYLHLFDKYLQCFSCARHYSRNWEYRSDQTSRNLFSHGAGIIEVCVCLCACTVALERKQEREDLGLGMGGLRCKRGGQGSPSRGGGNQVTRKR